MRNFFKNTAKWILPLSLVIVLVFGTVGTVSAAEFPNGETIPAGETIEDDVFIGGENVVVDGTVNGMLFAGGTSITINGTINGDALLMGEMVVVSDSAVINGNLFIAGGDLTMNGKVTGSVFSGSAELNVGSMAEVSRNFYYGGFSLKQGWFEVWRDLFAAGFQTLLSGDIERDLSVAAAAIELDGNIGRNALLDVGNIDESGEASSYFYFNPSISRYVDQVVEPGSVSQTCERRGELTYTSSLNINTELEAVTSAVVYQTPVPYESETSFDQPR